MKGICPDCESTPAERARFIGCMRCAPSVPKKTKKVVIKKKPPKGSGVWTGEHYHSSKAAAEKEIERLKRREL